MNNNGFLLTETKHTKHFRSDVNLNKCGVMIGLGAFVCRF